MPQRKDSSTAPSLRPSCFTYIRCRGFARISCELSEPEKTIEWLLVIRVVPREGCPFLTLRYDRRKGWSWHYRAVYQSGNPRRVGSHLQSFGAALLPMRKNIRGWDWPSKSRTIIAVWLEEAIHQCLDATFFSVKKSQQVQVFQAGTWRRRGSCDQTINLTFNPSLWARFPASIFLDVFFRSMGSASFSSGSWISA